MNNDPQMLDKYLRKGVSEIHWEGESRKLNHFELIKSLQAEYSDEIEKLIKRVIDNFDAGNIELIINNIDQNLPKELNNHKLPEERKELMVKLINLRFKKLSELI